MDSTYSCLLPSYSCLGTGHFAALRSRLIFLLTPNSCLLSLLQMGIRFSCSNGHKLNVKDELAGRRGRCPECGVSVQIPQQTERTESSSFSVVIDTSKTEKNESPEGRALLADPNAVWYLQVPHGPQYGPATGAVVESWIKERRVSPEMLVWKEGWSNWIPAKNAFPELTDVFSNTLKFDRPPSQESDSIPANSPVISLTPQVRSKIVRRKKMSRNTVILASLTGLIILLGILLVWVLSR